MKPAAPIEGLVTQSRILASQFSGEQEERLEIDGDLCCSYRAGHAERGPVGPGEIQQLLVLESRK